MLSLVLFSFLCSQKFNIEITGKELSCLRNLNWSSPLTRHTAAAAARLRILIRPPFFFLHSLNV
jgi:hypothetical protein